MKSNLKICSLLALLLAALLLTACSQLQDNTNPGTDYGPTLDENIYSAETSTEETVTAPKKLPTEIQDLLQKSADTTNYQYFFKRLIKDQNGNMVETASYTVAIKSSQIKKSYLEPQKLTKSQYYDTVYFNTDQKTALAVCVALRTLCDDSRNNATKIDYTTETIDALPLDLLKRIPETAKKISEETINNRRAMVIEYTNAQGLIERLAVDTYSGIPLRQEIFTLNLDEMELQQRNTFDLKGENIVKNADVTLPAEYTVVS